MSGEQDSPARESAVGFPGGAKGVTPPSDPGGRPGFLSDVIVELGFVDRDTVERAVEAAHQPGMTVGRILLESQALDEDQLSRAVAERHGFDHVALDEFEVDLGAAGLISRSAALRYRAVPVAFATDGALVVVLEDPVDALAVSDIAVMTKSDVRAAVASGPAIEALIQRLPDLDESRAAANREQAGLTASPEDTATSAPPASGAEPMDLVESSEPNSEPIESPTQPSEADDRLAALEAELASERAARTDLERQTSESQAAHQKLSEDLDRASARVEDLTSRLEQAEGRSRELGAERDRMREELDQAAGDVEEKLAILEGQLTSERAARSDLEGRSSEAEVADKELERSRATMDELNTRLEDAEGRSRELAAELDRMREELDEATAERERLAAELEKATDERDRLGAEVERKAAELKGMSEALQGAESERDEARDAIERATAERDAAREELDRAATERERWREEAAKHESSRKQAEETAQARERLRKEAEALASELDSARKRADEAERSAEEAVGRVTALEDADRRAETARHALAELREESDREREQSARLEVKLRAEIAAATERTEELEARLSKLLAIASEAREAANKLAALHSALGDEISQDGAQRRAEQGADPSPGGDAGPDRQGNGKVGDGSDDPADAPSAQRAERIDI